MNIIRKVVKMSRSLTETPAVIRETKKRMWGRDERLIQYSYSHTPSIYDFDERFSLKND